MEESGADLSRAFYLYWRLADTEYDPLDKIPVAMSKLAERHPMPEGGGAGSAAGRS